MPSTTRVGSKTTTSPSASWSSSGVVMSSQPATISRLPFQTDIGLWGSSFGPATVTTRSYRTGPWASRARISSRSRSRPVNRSAGRSRGVACGTSR